MQVLAEKGIEWRVGALYCTTHAGMRRIERQIKDCCHGPRFCEICSGQIPRLRDCKSYDPALCQFPITSTGLRVLGNHVRSDFGVRFSSDKETSRFVLWLKEVQHRDKDALGFIPVGGNTETGIDRLIAMGQVVIASENGRDVGFCAYTLNQSKTRVRIHQCVVMDEYRLRSHGKRMIDMIAMEYDTCSIDCYVRADLAANEFWLHRQFKQDGLKVHKTSGSVLNHYVRLPDPCVIDEEIPL